MLRSAQRLRKKILGRFLFGEMVDEPVPFFFPSVDRASSSSIYLIYDKSS
jgi:hypothetical protein